MESTEQGLAPPPQLELKIHEFFGKMKEKKYLVNQKALRNVRINKFSYYFDLLFGEMDEIHRRNMDSWLAAFAKSFTINMTYVKPFMLEEAKSLFQAFNLDPESTKDRNVFQFWLYLNKVYLSLRYQNYSGGDNIFGFTTGFPLLQTKVVIIGQDPTRRIKSSGFAFHLSPCISSQMLVDNLSNEMSLLSAMSRGDVSKMDPDKYDRAFKTGDLVGWINQGVLLINSRLTCSPANWSAHIRFLITYLSRTLENLVFIFVGKVAMEKVRFVNQKKHMIVKVVHPASYSYRRRNERPQQNLDWDKQLPFINTNFYKLQKSHSAKLIDWHYVNGKVGIDDGRLNSMRKYLLNLLDDARCQTLQQSERYSIEKLTSSGAGSGMEEAEVFMRRHHKGHLFIECVKTSVRVED